MPNRNGRTKARFDGGLFDQPRDFERLSHRDTGILWKWSPKRRQNYSLSDEPCSPGKGPKETRGTVGYDTEV